jgi:riboflavin transporter FmnP
MNSKAIGVIIVFTALVTALNFFRIPVPYMPTFTYQVADIGLVIAFLLFGIKIGVTVAVLNMLIKMAIFTSPGDFVGAPYYLVAFFTMVFGIYLFEKITKPKILTKQQFTIKSTFLSTVFGILTRTFIMIPIDYTVYGFLVSLVSGLSMSIAYEIVLASMPGIILYNITVPIFVIPTSYYIAKKVSKHYKSSLIHNSFM